MATRRTVRVRLVPHRYYTVDGHLHGPDEVVEVPADEAEAMADAGYALSPEHTELTEQARELALVKAREQAAATAEPVYPPNGGSRPAEAGEAAPTPGDSAA